MFVSLSEDLGVSIGSCGSVSFKKGIYIFTIKRQFIRKNSGYKTAIESTDAVYMIHIINRIGESHAFIGSRESLRNLFSVASYQIGNEQGFHIMCRLG